jgi:hypothetical protein
MRTLCQWALAALVVPFALSAPAGATGFHDHDGSGVGDEKRSPITDIVFKDLRTSHSDWWKHWMDTLKSSPQGPGKSDLFTHGSDHGIGKWRFDLADFQERFRSHHDHAGNSVIPEPATAFLLVAGLAALAGLRRRA